MFSNRQLFSPCSDISKTFLLGSIDQHTKSVRKILSRDFQFLVLLSD